MKKAPLSDVVISPRKQRPPLSDVVIRPMKQKISSLIKLKKLFIRHRVKLLLIYCHHYNPYIYI